MIIQNNTKQNGDGKKVNEIENVSEKYYCIFCGKKMMYIKEDSLTEVFCDCSKWKENYFKEEKIESYRYKPKGKLEKKIYDDISKSKARLDNTIEKYQNSIAAIRYSEDILENVVIDHVNWDDFDMGGKNALIEEICRRILKLERIDLHESESDLIGLKQAKRLILSSERKAKSYEPTEEERREIEAKYPLKFGLNKEVKKE